MPGSDQGLERTEPKIRTDLLAEKYRNEQLKIRLDKSEALVITLGTSSPVKRKRTAQQEHKDDGSDQGSSSDGDEDEDGGEDEDEQEQSSSSSSYNGQEGTEAPPGADQDMRKSPDLSAPRADPNVKD